MIAHLKKHHKTLLLVTISVVILGLGFPQATVTKFTTTGYVFPIVGTRLSSTFGVRKHPVLKVRKHHNGVDLAAPNGSIIRSIHQGTVVFADPHGGYGNLIVIEHENKLTSHYGHCKSIWVKPGQKVKAGEIIGTVGQTGRVTGPHLHFEIRKNGKPQNPGKYIPGLGEKALG